MLEEQQLRTELQRKAMAKLVGLQFRFQYKEGIDNGAAECRCTVARQSLTAVANDFQLSSRLGTRSIKFI